MIRPARFFDIHTVAAFLLPVLLFIMPGIARGHAYPDHADPKVGSTVATPPTVVRIWFDGDLEPEFSSIMVHTAGGSMVDKNDGRVDPADPALLEVSVPPLPPGSYIVYWTAVSRDGHRTSGSYTFTVK